MNIPDNFGAIEPPYDGYEKSKVVILPAPFEGTVSYGKGTCKGPGAIFEASKNIELYEDGRNIFEVGIHTLPELNVKNKKALNKLDGKRLLSLTILFFMILKLRIIYI